MMHWTSTTWVHRQFRVCLRVSPRVCRFAKISLFWVQTSLNQFKPAESLPTGGESYIATQIGRRWRASSWASGWSVLECTQRCEWGRHIWMCLWPVLHQTERSDLTWFDQNNNNKKQLSAAFLGRSLSHSWVPREAFDTWQRVVWILSDTFIYVEQTWDSCPCARWFVDALVYQNVWQLWHCSTPL